MRRYVDHMIDQLRALQASVARLSAIVQALQPSQLTELAYPSEWTISDTLSHLGSGAVIMRSTLVAVAGGGTVADGFNQSVWEEWNAKSPSDQAAGVLVADQEFLASVEALTPEQRASVQFPFGPMTLGLADALGMRLNEHALHTWDVEVALDPTAVLSEQSAAVILGSLPMIARFAGKADGLERTQTIRTSAPVRDFTLATGASTVSLTEGAGDGASLDLPAESLVRLVYGRLDPDHTPATVDAETIAALRPLFPGF